jgi:hypothetical protein
MRKLIGFFIILLAAAGGYLLFDYYRSIEENQGKQEEEAPVEVIPTQLSGMDYKFEESLGKAQQQGTKAFGEWLKKFGPYIYDPRKAWIELDYVVMLAKDDPAAARQLFKQVKARTPANSPIYPRIKKLSATYGD